MGKKAFLERSFGAYFALAMLKMIRSRFDYDLQAEICVFKKSPSEITAESKAVGSRHHANDCNWRS
jgi:hypothetical protein